MAEENEDGQEKTEDPSERRIQKAREDGQVARSKELSTVLSLLFGMASVYIAGVMIAQGLERIATSAFSLRPIDLTNKNLMTSFLGQAMNEVIWGVVVIGGAGMLAAIAGNLGVGGYLFSIKSLLPKGSRMNPLSGLKRMFGLNSLIELIKGILKVVLIASVGAWALNTQIDELLALGDMPIQTAIREALLVVLFVVLLMIASLVLVAAIDIPYQLFDHKKKLRMSLKEVKDEYKETEGSPELKGKVRQMQRELANRRMMQNLPEADVVVTNPTHYSVALKYDAEAGGAPVVIAKGKDEMARRIREKASEYGIARLETPPLARALYHCVEVDHEIPAGLYVAVAQVLAYVFQLNQYFKGRTERPPYPSNLPIPSELRVDPD